MGCAWGVGGGVWGHIEGGLGMGDRVDAELIPPVLLCNSNSLTPGRAATMIGAPDVEATGITLPRQAPKR